MYFPYLRGRQFELLALRELVEKRVLSERIIPIIEPVRLSSTLVKTIETYGKENIALSLVVNPKVGEFVSSVKEPKNKKLKERFKAVRLENSKLLATIILLPNNEKSIEKLISKYDGNMMTICDNKDAIPAYEAYFTDKDVKYNLIPDDRGFRRKVRSNRVIFEDRFNKLPRNIDYEKVEDEPFSEDHLYYREDDYIGFADYSIIGDEYSDTGFAPFAVAIHIVYFADDNSLRIRHFVSDSNDDISDPAGKFREALSKLIEWNKNMKLDTKGIKAFEELYVREAYPGLGTVKKLSIMHHLELIGRYLDKE